MPRKKNSHDHPKPTPRSVISTRARAILENTKAARAETSNDHHAGDVGDPSLPQFAPISEGDP